MTGLELKKLVRKKAKSGRFEIHRLGSAALREIRELGPLSMAQNNRVCELRNYLADFYFKQLSDIVLAIESGLVLDTPHNPRDSGRLFATMDGESCQICGEDRAIQRCHVLPAREGGDLRENMIPLCPTHHFLLDHHRLSHAEFEKISLDGVDKRAQEYFDKVLLERHRVLWARDELVNKGQLAPCDICGKHPKFQECVAGPLPPESGVMTIWLSCKCFLNSREFEGNDREMLRKQAVASWNAGERKNRWTE